jgi:Flp pilus assembly protein TadG
MELVLVLPILMILLMGFFEFSLLFYARGDVVHASRVGARYATLSGVTEEDVANEVSSNLPPSLRRGLRVASQLGQHAGDEVTVTVAVPSTSAAPDLLWLIGYSIQNEPLVAQTRMRKE